MEYSNQDSVRALLSQVAIQAGGDPALVDIANGYFSVVSEDMPQISSSTRVGEGVIDSILSSISENKGKILTLIGVIASYLLFKGMSPATVFSRGTTATSLTAALSDLSPDERATARQQIAQPPELGLWDKILGAVGYETDNYQIDKIKQIRRALNIAGVSLGNFIELQAAFKELTKDDFEFYMRAEAALRG